MKRTYTASILALGLILPAIPAQAQDTTTPPPPVAAPGQGDCESGVYNAQGQCEEQSDSDGTEVRPGENDPNNPNTPANPNDPNNPGDGDNQDAPGDGAGADDGAGGAGTPN